MSSGHLKGLFCGVTRQGPTTALGASAILNWGGAHGAKDVFHRLRVMRVIIGKMTLGAENIAAVEGGTFETTELTCDPLLQFL
jgi:hypothetical protein